MNEKITYTPIRVSTLKAELDIPFNLYIFFKEQYICYSNSGNCIPSEKYKKLRRQKIAKFFILGQDESNYQNFLDELLNITLNDSSVSVDDKVEMVEGAALGASEQMLKDPTSKSAYNMTKNAARSLRKLIEENPDALKKMFSKDSEIKDDLIIRHSINVSALALKFAKLMKCSDDEIDNISVAALMHEVGINELDEETQKLFSRPRDSFSPEEKELFNQHCIKIKDRLGDKPYINKEILHLVENHEENRMGQGPLKSSNPSVAVEILSLCNRYDETIITEQMTPKEALNKVMLDELGSYDLTMINQFKKVLKQEGIV